MSNKLKTLSTKQLEMLIADKIGDYIGEKCRCHVKNINTPNIDSETDIALHDVRDIHFEVILSYEAG